MIKAVSLFLALLIPNLVLAHTNYIGYSGAPGSNGYCSGSCHAQYSFSPTITVAGFPEIYEPGQQYTIFIGHISRASINQFNASVRAGDGEENAGLITQGPGTETYDTAGETNGVRWSSANSDSGNFIWTAPDSGVGEVRLYWAGLQGSRSFGADTQLVLIGTEYATDIKYTPGSPIQFSLNQNYPNPFNKMTKININIARAGRVDFIITNILGQLVYNWNEEIAQPGTFTIPWNGMTPNGGKLPSGIYFYRLRSSEGTLTKKLMLLR